jgi:hypothetical protein
MWKGKNCQVSLSVSSFLLLFSVLGYFAWTQFKKHGSLGKSIDSVDTIFMQNSPTAR